mmetsp:Transcript_18443/g.21180  ORF Transcript_18443/g.21180 Transcript_18443/m.21180 type:complete len:95 (-) Transcript_18443:60-344(-)
MYITLVLLAYLYLTEPQPYFTTGMFVIVMVFTGPMGVLSIALNLALFEDATVQAQLAADSLKLAGYPAFQTAWAQPALSVNARAPKAAKFAAMV